MTTSFSAQEFIYLHGLYRREPQDKPLLRVEELDFQQYLELTEEAEALLCASVLAQHPGRAALCGRLRQLGDRVLLLRQGEAVLGFAAFRCLDSHQLFTRLGSAPLCAFVRRGSWICASCC